MNNITINYINSSKYLSKKLSKNSKNISKNSKNYFKVQDGYNFNYVIYSFLSNNNFRNYYFDDEDDKEDFEITDIIEAYRDLIEVFSKIKADKLPPNRFTDCKIVL